VYDAVPPLAVIVWLYAVPIVPFDKPVGASVICGHPVTESEYAWVPGQPFESLAVTVNE
jgi:hypothetical protein